MNNFKRILCTMLALVTLATASAIMAVPAEAATTGIVTFSESSYCTVTLSNTSKPAYVTFNCKMQGILKFSGKATIVLRDQNNRWLCEWSAKDGDRLYLGCDHSQYRIYVKGTGFYDWSISNPSNCTIK